MIPSLPKDSLLVGDIGFGGFDLLWQLSSGQVVFVIRCGGNSGQLGNLMPERLGTAWAGLEAQRGMAVFAGLGNMVDQVVHPLGWQTQACVPGVSGLPAGLSSGRRLRWRFRGRRWVRRGRKRGAAGMDVEPVPEFANFGLKSGDLGLQRHNQPEQFGAFGAAGGGHRQGVTHASYYRPEPPRISRKAKRMLHSIWTFRRGAGILALCQGD